MATLDFMKTARAGEKHKSGSRHMRRKEEREIAAQALVQAKKELQGMSIPAMKKLIRRKIQENKNGRL